MLPCRSILLSHAPHSTLSHRLPLFTLPTIPTPSIFPRKALSENAPRLRNFRKYCTKNALCLRNSRKYYAKMYLTCGISANMIQKRFLLAELPQILHKDAFYLRYFRKCYAKVHFACGTSANGMQFKNTPYYIITPFAR